MNNTRGRRGQQTFTSIDKGDDYNNRDKNNFQCYSCNQFGHYSTKYRRKAPSEVYEQANYIEEEDQLHYLSNKY
jgi:hypothetical protein